MRKIKTGMVVVAGALLLSGCHGGSRPEGAAATTAVPATSATAPAAGSGPAPITTAAAAPAGTPTDGKTVRKTISGTLFYTGNDLSAGSALRLYAWHGSRLTTIVRGYGVLSVEASPDGGRLAYVLDNGDLMVANADGTKARKLGSHAVTAGFGPTWSGDSSKLVMARAVNAQTWQAGTVRVADGKFVALPKSIQGNIHYRSTDDGTRYFYSDGRCSILSAKANGTGIRKVPGLGLEETATNPRRLRACDIVSLNRDGSRMTVDLHVGNQTDGDIGGSQSANSVIDTATGKVLALPVHGTVRQALYLRDGTLLVRSGPTARPVLTLLSASLEVLATRTEPASVRNLVLRDYTP
jgi:TolB protein